MQKDDKVSIIIPIYNAKKYLKKCLNSIINQRYENIEIICINDGSTDNSLEILKEYKKKDNRIQIIDKNNTGVSNTRNLGIKYSKGSYIFFIDADDIIDKNTIRSMLDVAEKNNSEIIICTNNLIDRNSKERIIKFEIEHSETENIKNIYKEKTFEYLYKLGLAIPIWNKLIKKDFIENYCIRFNEKMTYDEDLFFCWECIIYANYIYIINNPLYKYRLTYSSAIMKYHENLYEKYKIEFNQMAKIMKGQNYKQEYIEYVNNLIFRDKIKIVISMIGKSKKKFKVKKQEIENILINSKDTCINYETKDLLTKMYKKGMITQNTNMLIIWSKLLDIKNKIARIIK